MTQVIVKEKSGAAADYGRPIPSEGLGLGCGCAACVFRVRELKAPTPAGPTAAAGEFSVERAMLHVNQIARSPHPIGSANAAEVREYVLAQLSALGMDPQVFPAISVHKSARNIVVGDTRYIVGRLSGTSKAVLLMAHYDSVDPAPGAADDGAAAGAILEAVRALRAGPAALKNDLIVLFTDGEEAGLLGADAFVSAHPWVKDVGVVLQL